MTKVTALLILGALLVAACATGKDRMLRGAYYGVEYSTVAEAEAVRRAARASALAEIKALPQPLVASTLRISIPSLAAMHAHQASLGGATNSYQIDFFVSDARESALFIAEAIKRRGLYVNVEIVEESASSSVPVPMPNIDRLYFRLGSTTAGQYYFSSERVGQVVVNGDASASSAGGFVQGLLSQVTALALAG